MQIAIVGSVMRQAFELVNLAQKEFGKILIDL
jgi:hypothetical protein